MADDVVHVDDAVPVGVPVEREDGAVFKRFIAIGLILVKAGQESEIPLTPNGIARADKPLQAECREVLRKVSREVAPFRIVAGEQHGHSALSLVETNIYDRKNASKKSTREPCQPRMISRASFAF